MHRVHSQGVKGEGLVDWHISSVTTGFICGDRAIGLIASRHLDVAKIIRSEANDERVT